jgi:chemotaxis protein CheX
MMNAPNPAMSSTPAYDGWLPMLQMATREVFELMLASPLQDSPDPLPQVALDITAMVGLAGHLCGVLTLRCTGKSAARMASRMLGIDADKADPEMWDAIGEVCNMVAGNFKNKIPGLGDGCMLSVPTVITGENYTLHTMVTEEINTILLFDGEPLAVCLEIHS